ncbi:peroxisome biogenesis factor 10 [Drosophila erecta]|uniref:RING-type domain-containing protein n=1 Tax=Drosophila erecta TaxID=7220 RepID=B3NRI4_DROER|nr:peroxisome biogenesis factor 10 [Drosophila erecta]EDV56136.1 uncharacterized protein Dere_GG22477 [Drosophila erecta]
MSSQRQCVCVPIETIDLCSPEAKPAKRRCRELVDPDDPYRCPICMEYVRRRQPGATKCGHVFCFGCIDKAIRSFEKCPICNRQLTIGQILPIFL